jgi:hypothetical protein
MFMSQEKNKKKESDEVTLRDVEREMAKPRIAKSARRATAVDPGGGSPVSEQNRYPSPAS